MTPPRLLAISGWSGSGKTTLLRALLPLLGKRGLAVAVAKHHGEGLETDRPGKDSLAYRRAGASPSFLVGPELVTAWAELPSPDAWQERVLAMCPHVDLLLCEGFKNENLPRIEVLGSGPDLPRDGRTLARVAWWNRPEESPSPFDDGPTFPAEAREELADFLVAWCRRAGQP